MLNIGDKITQLRKQHNLFQSDWAKKIDVSRTIIGNYERNINTSSIDILIKIAKVFNISLDYFTGDGQLSQYNNDIIKRMDDIEELDNETKKALFSNR